MSVALLAVRLLVLSLAIVVATSVAGLVFTMCFAAMLSPDTETMAAAALAPARALWASVRSAAVACSNHTEI